MGRNVVEFYCTNCHYYNYPTLRSNLTGNFTILCGKCKHHHYRTIVNGVVTEDRHSDKYGQQEIIHTPESAAQPEKRKFGELAAFRQMEFAGRAS